MGDLPEQSDAPAAPVLTKAEAMVQVLALPEPLTVALTPEQIVAKLDAAARRGKLAAFERRAAPLLFRVEAFGTPFEGTLNATASTSAEGTTLTYSRAFRPAWPWGFAMVLILSVWPGVVLTESLLAATFPSWTWLWKTTYYWYLPLAIVGGIWGWIGAIKKSRLTVAASAHEMAEKIAAILRG